MESLSVYLGSIQRPRWWSQTKAQFPIFHSIGHPPDTSEGVLSSEDVPTQRHKHLPFYI